MERMVTYIAGISKNVGDTSFVCANLLNAPLLVIRG